MMVPFLVKIANEVPDFGERLQVESEGIFAWMVRGCRDWREMGLNPPASVTEATTKYRESQDVFGRFLAERCVRHPEYRVRAGELYKAYSAWCETNGATTQSGNGFAEDLAREGFQKTKIGSNWYLGLMLRQDREDQ
jgi:putative DNA primase/helicase